MGRDKAFIEMNGKPIIARVIESMMRICSETIIVANDAARYSQFALPVVADVHPGKGSLGGIYSGLRAGRHEHVLAVACDMPFLNEDLLRYMISLTPKFDVIIPQVPTRSGKTRRGALSETHPLKTSPHPNQPLAKERDLHPLHAVYSRDCLGHMEEKIRSDDLRLIAFFDEVRVRTVDSDEVDRFDPEHWSLFNVNTPEDLEIAKQRVE